MAKGMCGHPNDEKNRADTDADMDSTSFYTGGREANDILVQPSVSKCMNK